MKNLGKALLYCIRDVMILSLGVGICLVFKPLLPSNIAADFCDATGLILGMIVLAMYYKSEGLNLIKECKFTTVKSNLILKTILITICFMFFSELYEKVTINILHIGVPSYQEVQRYFSDLSTNWYGFMSIIIFAPILEEIVFRGIILRQCLKFLNPISAIILQAILFGLAHMNMIRSIHSFIFGIIIGYIAYYTKSILPGIIMHSISNLLAITKDPITETIYGLSYFPIIGVLGLALTIFLVYSFKENSKVKVLA